MDRARVSIPSDDGPRCSTSDKPRTSHKSTLAKVVHPSCEPARLTPDSSVSTNMVLTNSVDRRSAPLRTAEFKFAQPKSAPWRTVFRRYVSLRSASRKLAPRRSAPERSARLKSAQRTLASLRSMPGAASPRRLASTRSGRIFGFSCRHAFQTATPWRISRICSESATLPPATIFAQPPTTCARHVHPPYSPA